MIKIRMHSSRWCLPAGCLPGGGYPGGRVCPVDISAQGGCLARGAHPHCMLGYIPPCEQND